jgi:hypothetical protein
VGSSEHAIQCQTIKVTQRSSWSCFPRGVKRPGPTHIKSPVI